MVTGLAFFGAAVDQGLVYNILSADRSRLCIVIALLYLATTIHCARHTWLVSMQLNRTRNSTRASLSSHST